VATDIGDMNSKAAAGLKRYGKGRKTKTIAADLEGKADDPQALAAWIRRYSLGDKEFREQRSARAKRSKK